MRYLALAVCLVAAGSIRAEEPPHTVLKSDSLRAKVYHTDPEKGYYRGVRFDWSGVLGEVEFQGHKFFNPWKAKHDPTGHDDILGPVQEFSQTDPPGYAAAKVGESFLKIGVGELEKIAEEKYRFFHPYKLVNRGERVFQSDEAALRFQHKLDSKSGYGYDYRKRVWIQAGNPNVIWFLHSLENTGKKTIETEVYNHNFFNVDSDGIGRSYEIGFPYEPKLSGERERAKDLLKASGTALVFSGDLDRGTVYTEITGFPTEKRIDPKRDGYKPDFTLRHLKSGLSVGVWCDRPLTSLRLWAAPTALCPEPFVKVVVDPGKTFTWTWRYEFGKGK